MLKPFLLVCLLKIEQLTAGVNQTYSNWDILARVRYFVIDNINYDDCAGIIDDDGMSNEKYKDLKINNGFARDLENRISLGLYDSQFSYDEFMVDIVSVSLDKAVDADYILSGNYNDSLDTKLYLNAQIWLTAEDQGYLEFKIFEHYFLNEMTDYIQEKLGNNRTIFSITGDDNTLIFKVGVSSREDKSYPYVIFLVIWIGFIIIVYILAILYEKNCFVRCRDILTDGTDTFSILIIGAQVWDFTSDIHLCIDISKEYSDTKKDVYLYLVIFSIACMIIPYVCNLIIAANILSIKVVNNNEHASQYITKHGQRFIILTIITGGAYPSLLLLSSNVFALALTTTGLTGQDLMQLRPMKLSTIILQNLPQLLVQIGYCINIKSFNTPIILAFISSILSIALTIFGAVKTRYKSINGEYIHYELHFEYNSTNEAFNEAHNMRIRKHRWQRKKLGNSIIKSLGLQYDSIEIGYISITLKSIIIYIVHGITYDEINKIKNNFEDDRFAGSMTSLIAVSFLYHWNTLDIIDKIVTHFNFNDNENYTIEFISNESNKNIVNKYDKLISITLAQKTKTYEIMKTLYGNQKNNNELEFNQFLNQQQIGYLIDNKKLSSNEDINTKNIVNHGRRTISWVSQTDDDKYKSTILEEHINKGYHSDTSTLLPLKPQ